MHREPDDSDSSGLDEVLADYMRRLDRGEPIDQDALIATHPELAAELRAYFSQAAEMDRVAAGATSNLGARQTHRNALLIRCPHCHVPAEIAVDAPLTDLTCAACGSHYSLVDQNKATWTAPPLSKMGRFDLIERLGVGGFGSVWKARDKELDRTVAIKIPRAGGMSAEEQEKFFREARAAAQLKHPSIVSVHEVGRDGDSVFIVSDFVRGVTLDDWLTGQKFTSREAAELCIIIADALEHAHGQGVVHRDLKPANIMIDGDGRPHLMDFGLARRVVGEVTVTKDGQLLGTPAYMSPEQAKGEAHTADRRSDVYSLGVIFFQLLTGELPFRGNARMLMHQVIHDDPPSPRKLNASVAKDLETITLKCLEKDPARRYQSAGELAAELRRFAAGEPIHARPITRVERAWRWWKRRPMAAAFASLLAVLTIAGPIVAINQMILRRSAESNLDLARRTSYDLTLMNASFLANNDKSQALTILEDASRCPVGFRELAWSFHVQQLRQHDRCLQGHTAKVRSLDISPDGRLLVTASNDGTAKVLDTSTGKIVHDLKDHPGGDTPTLVFGAAFSKDGTQIATVCQRAVCVWNPVSGQKIAEFATPDLKSPDGDIAYSPMDDRFVSAGRDDMYVWSNDSLKTLKPTKPPIHRPGSVVSALAWSPDGKTLATADHGASTVTLWDPETWEPRAELQGHKHWVWGVAFSHDSRLVASASWDQTARIWNVETQKMVHELDVRHGLVLTAAFSPDNRLLATGGSDGVISIWHVDTGNLMGELSGHSDSVERLVFADRGNILLSASGDGTVRTWRIGETDEGLYSLGFTAADEPMLSTEATQDRRLWSVDQRIRGITGHFRPDSPATAIRMLKGGEILATGCEDGSIVLFDLAQRRITKRLKGAHVRLNRIAFSDDGQVSAAIGDDHQLRIWGTEDKPRFDMKVPLDDGNSEGLLFDVAVSPDGRHVAVGGDLNLTIIDARSGNVVARRYGHNNQVLSVAYTPDGRMLASGSRDNLIGLWDVASYERVALLTGHTSAVQHVAFSADGTTLVSCGDDRTVRLWNVASRSLTQTLRGHATAVTRAIIPRIGETILSLDYYGTVMLWDARLGHSLGQFNLRQVDLGQQRILDLAVSETGSMWIAALAERDGQVLLWQLKDVKVDAD